MRIAFQLPLSGSPNPIPGFSGSPRLSAAAPLRKNVFFRNYFRIFPTKTKDSYSEFKRMFWCTFVIRCNCQTGASQSQRSPGMTGAGGGIRTHEPFRPSGLRDRLSHPRDLEAGAVDLAWLPPPNVKRKSPEKNLSPPEDPSDRIPADDRGIISQQRLRDLGKGEWESRT